jgi:hypothetical protein
MTKDETMISLYDYRGHADYDKKGRDVYEAAKRKGIVCESREIENPGYTGMVLLYPKWFLDEYFHPKTNQTVQEILDDDLPF